MKKNTNSPWQAVGLVGTLGVEITLVLIAGIWAGKAFDRAYGMDPLGLVIGIFGGLIVGIASALFTLRTFMKD